jgi:hypothetical protein
MYRCTAGKLTLRALPASRALHTSSSSRIFSSSRQNAVVAGRKPLALVARGSLQRRSYAIAAEESNKGVVRLEYRLFCLSGMSTN